MIYVTNGNDVEPLVLLSSFEMSKEVKGDYSISFTSINNEKNVGHSLLQGESIITVDDFDFRVKQMKETRQGKHVVALSTYFDLIGVRKSDIYGGTRTFNEFLNFTFKDTGWRTSTDFNESRFIENYGENNVVALTSALCQAFECEFEIRANNLIHFSKKIGGDNDAQYRYGHNVQALSKNEDTTKLRTYIEGWGYQNAEQGVNIYASYESPYASKYGRIEAETFHDDRYTTGESLLEALKNALIDYPEVTLELDTIELLDKELGERVWLIYEPLDMEFETRILTQTKEFRDGELRTVKVTLGNTMPKTTTDILISQKVEIDENKKITRSKFEQTNDRINLKVEEINGSLSELDIRADKIEASVKDNKDNISKLEIRATGIEANVKDNKDNIASLKIEANQIDLRVRGLDNRMGEAESNITMNMNQIEIKTRGDNLISSINVAPSGVSINADKINLNGAVIANGTITGSSSISIATDATVGNNLYLGQSGGYKSVNFGSGSNITYNGSYMELSSSNVRLNGSSNELNGYNTIYGTLNIPSTTNLIGVVRAESSGIGISVSGNGKTLYVKVNGSTVGSVQLT
ncbi:phage tail spike protein [Lysinibacillus xylanilyticus]|uniref:phage tail spike protein n=1 Tax=Lysinibacillus xylanilyticus TaxID=582475 RepID=UPI00380D864A